MNTPLDKDAAASEPHLSGHPEPGVQGIFDIAIFLAFSDFHLPCFLKRRSGTPALAAVEAPPTRKLCRPNSLLG